MFTEFYCNASTGSNMNGGSDENTSPSYTATNGGWNSGTGVFTPTSGDPSASVTVGQFAHVFADGATTPTFIGRVTAVDSTTVTVSTTAKSGTAPGTAGSGVSINVGGVWKGPNGTVTFPFAFITAAQTNASGDTPRVNLKNNAQYDVTAAISRSVAGPTRFQGYSSTVGDGGRATIDGGATGSSYVLMSLDAANNELVDLIFSNNGNSGSADLANANASECYVARCVFHDCRGSGLSVGAVGGVLVEECEAYNTGVVNTGTRGGFVNNSGSSVTFLRCIAHDNSTGTACHGFSSGNGASTCFIGCISDTNAGNGFHLVSASGDVTIGCEAYNNSGDGIRLANASAGFYVIENTNLVKNGGYGINGNGAGARMGAVINCGFGAGTQANTSGTTTSLKSIVESGSVTYASNVTPWTDPANGDFRISLAAAKGAGRGAFTETASSYSGTVGYPDIGAAQSQSTSGGGLLTNPGMGGGMRG